MSEGKGDDAWAMFLRLHLGVEGFIGMKIRLGPLHINRDHRVLSVSRANIIPSFALTIRVDPHDKRVLYGDIHYQGGWWEFVFGRRG